MEFAGRKNELIALNDRHRKRASQMVVVYGRRRVGKSALIRRFMQGKKALYHVGDRSSRQLQMQKLLQLAADVLNEPLYKNVVVKDWDQLFDLILPHLKKEKIILAFDEFQWMCESSPELRSVLQKHWDLHWEKTGKVFLILCGSYVGFMEREILGKKSPLYGRRTSQIFLKPLSYIDSRAFHPSLSLDNSARVYALLGGIPAYLLAFDGRCSVEENIINECLSPEGRLFDEPRFLTMEELRDPVVYFSLMETLRNERLGVTEIAKRMAVDKSSLSYYLNTLQQLGFVERVEPLGVQGPVREKSRYLLKDPFLSFWFSLVFPYLNDLNLRGPKNVFLSQIKPRLDAFYGHRFERLCSEAVPYLLEKKKVTASYRIGTHWSREAQIDLVVERTDGVTYIGECKWQSRPVGKMTADQLIARIKTFPNPRQHTLIPLLFSRTDFTDDLKSDETLETYTLKDLYDNEG